MRAADSSASSRETRRLLTKIPGIGKKTAERVVLELADPFARKWTPDWSFKARRGKSDPLGYGHRHLARIRRSDATPSRRWLGLGFAKADVTRLFPELWLNRREPPRS